MRAVPDTKILVSAYNFPGGAPEAVYRLALEGRMDLVTSPPLLAELGRVLMEKFDWDPGRAEHAVAQVAQVGFVVRPAKRIRVVKEDGLPRPFADR